jgi:hypothetical protein
MSPLLVVGHWLRHVDSALDRKSGAASYRDLTATRSSLREKRLLAVDLPRFSGCTAYLATQGPVPGVIVVGHLNLRLGSVGARDSVRSWLPSVSFLKERGRSTLGSCAVPRREAVLVREAIDLADVA